jgi:Iap family predicted aminopeptidase
VALQLADQVSPERLMADVRWLADDERRGRLTGSPEEDVVGAWLVQRFQGLGLDPFAAAGLEGYYLPFEAPAITRYGRVTEEDVARGEDIVAVLPGTTRPDSYVYIGAHYDHLGVSPGGQVYNGADDDATGVAAVLEAARVFSVSGLQPQETLVFVAFSGEEIGGLGSAALCERLTAAGLADRSMMLNMEVLGAQKGRGTYLDVWDEESAATGPLVEAVQWAGEKLDLPVKRQGRDPGSDALQLLKCGVPAVSVDVAWSPENHPHFHDPSDDAQHIDVEGFESAVRVAVAALWLLANDG